jgi:hypothetical protein
VCAPHLAHAAGAEQFPDLEAVQARARHGHPYPPSTAAFRCVATAED